MKTYQFILLCMLCCVLITCKKDKDDQQMLTTSYLGVLTLKYSRDFPDFSQSIGMNVDINKAGDVTFGNGGSKDFDATGIKNDDRGNPALKLKMKGSLVFNSAKGRCNVLNNQELLFVSVDSQVSGTMTIWIWDNDKKEWIEPPSVPHVIPFEYQDSYSDGEMQFSISTVVDSEIKVTLPDVNGTWTYGYTLSLMFNPN